MALRVARERAGATQRAIVVSVTQSFPWRDPLAVFAAASLLAPGDATYWETPSTHRVYVGAGSAATLSGEGSEALACVAAQWSALLRDAVIVPAEGATGEPLAGPLVFGGFAFDPLAARTPLWEGFPAGALTLPRALVAFDGDAVTLTLNDVLRPDEPAGDDALDRRAEALARDARRLRDAREVYAPMSAAPHHAVALGELRPGDEWRALVAETTAAIRCGAYQKVVLARGVEARLVDAGPDAFDIPTTLRRLRTQSPGAFVFAFQRGARTFIGATPERLARVEAQGDRRRVTTMALAGTTARDASAQALLHSPKNRVEHSIVARTIRNALAPLCEELESAAAPRLLEQPSVQHLVTPISGWLRPGVSALDVVAALHPTPAVGGFPRAAAVAAIREREGLDRGWYAGPVGWIGPDGVGEFAVALRSALVERDCATLFAGCGIVAGSDPQAEYAESNLKLQVMLRGLGLTEAPEA